MEQISAFIEGLGNERLVGNSLRDYLVVTLLIIVGVMLSRLARFLMARYLPRLTGATATDLDDRVIEGAIGPLSAMVLLPTFHICAYILDLPGALRVLIMDGLVVAFALLLTTIAVRSVDTLFRAWGGRQTRLGRGVDPQVIAFGRKFAKILVVLIAALIVLQRVGLDIMSLITGLGIGGLAVALAAQETLGNVLGSLQIMTDQPFTAGDFIRYDSTFGQVRDIGLRSTKLMTASGVRVVVPNKRLAEGVIENCSVHQGLTVQFSVGLVYGTSADQLEAAVELLREIVSAHPSVSSEVKVNFLAFGASSLDLQVVYFITDFANNLSVQHDINMSIKRRFDEQGLDFAFPTRTLHVVQDAPQS